METETEVVVWSKDLKRTGAHARRLHGGPIARAHGIIVFRPRSRRRDRLLLPVYLATSLPRIGYFPAFGSSSIRNRPLYPSNATFENRNNPFPAVLVS